jgi:hypothetical protein
MNRVEKRYLFLSISDGRAMMYAIPPRTLVSLRPKIEHMKCGPACSVDGHDRMQVKNFHTFAGQYCVEARDLNRYEIIGDLEVVP